MKTVLTTTSSFGKQDPAPLESLSAAGFNVVPNPFGRKLTEEEVSELIQKHDPVGMVAGVEPLTRAVMEKCQNLKVISRCGIGMDSIDLDAARDLGIMVTNTPDAPTIPVAELTLGMILSLLRQICISDASIRKGAWERPMGTLLHGKTVGIIGCGRIGTYLAGLLSPFGCRLLGHDPFCDQHKSLQLLTMSDLLTQSDIVTLHLPYSQATHHLLNTEKIGQMKAGAILINAARGGLVDEDALYEALASGHLGGVALDCFEEEPYNGELKDLDNTLLTGHIGSYAKEGRAIMEIQAAQNLIDQLQN